MKRTEQFKTVASLVPKTFAKVCSKHRKIGRLFPSKGIASITNKKDGGKDKGKEHKREINNNGVLEFQENRYTF